MAARKNKLELSDDWKERIRAGVLMDRLLKCAEGSIEMTSVQIKAADIILKKIVPDLNRTDIQPLGSDGKPSDGFNININHIKADNCQK